MNEGPTNNNNNTVVVVRLLYQAAGCSARTDETAVLIRTNESETKGIKRPTDRLTD